MILVFNTFSVQQNNSLICSAVEMPQEWTYPTLYVES